MSASQLGDLVASDIQVESTHKVYAFDMVTQTSAMMMDSLLSNGCADCKCKAPLTKDLCHQLTALTDGQEVIVR